MQICCIYIPWEGRGYRFKRVPGIHEFLVWKPCTGSVQTNSVFLKRYSRGSSSITEYNTKWTVEGTAQSCKSSVIFVYWKVRHLSQIFIYIKSENFFEVKAQLGHLKISKSITKKHDIQKSAGPPLGPPLMTCALHLHHYTAHLLVGKTGSKSAWNCLHWQGRSDIPVIRESGTSSLHNKEQESITDIISPAFPRIYLSLNTLTQTRTPDCHVCTQVFP